MKRISVAIAALLSIALLPAAHAASLHRSYAYFPIHGNSIADLERELRNSGPYLESDHRHHAGAARMRFATKVQYGLTKGVCRVAKANVSLGVTITLPRWSASRPPDDPYLLIVWDVLSKDIRRHEEHHVALAQRHADRLENTLRHLAPTKGCEAIKRKVEQATKTELRRNEADQAAFDRSEQASFRTRFKRLFDQRLRALERH